MTPAQLAEHIVDLAYTRKDGLEPGNLEDWITQAIQAATAEKDRQNTTLANALKLVDKYGQRLHATVASEQGWNGPTLQEVIDQALLGQ